MYKKEQIKQVVYEFIDMLGSELNTMMPIIISGSAAACLQNQIPFATEIVLLGEFDEPEEKHPDVTYRKETKQVLQNMCVGYSMREVMDLDVITPSVDKAIAETLRFATDTKNFDSYRWILRCMAKGLSISDVQRAYYNITGQAFPKICLKFFETFEKLKVCLPDMIFESYPGVTDWDKMVNAGARLL